MPSLSGSVTAAQSSSMSTLTTGALTSVAKDVIVIGISIPSATVTVRSITDSAGNTYSNRTRTHGTGISGEVWTAPSPSASTSNTITITLSSATSGWAVAAGSYSGVSAFDAAGTAQSANSSAVSVSATASNPAVIMIGHVFTTPAVTTSGLTSGYLDIPGSSTSYLVHQSYLLRGVTGSNTFAETLSASQNHVAILIALVITEWSSIAESGKPFVTVSPGGIENGLATIPNNGADFGPDSTVGGVMTSTSGIQEALNYGYVNDAAVVLLEGTFNITSPIMLESYATLTGQGRQSVIQALAGFSSSGSLLYFDTTKGANIDNITIAHLAIIGNNGASSTGITATAGTG